MRNAETVLAVIRDRGRRGLPLEDVYRQLFNPDLYLHAYGKIARNVGALTPGSTPETADGMSREKIARLIAALRHERYRWTPVRRTYIPKKSGKVRPLGLPTWSDKLLQEVLRLLLEAYYEPQFRACSHGFRPGRGCHTALQTIKRTWNGASWFIEGDIAQCFDTLDHGVLLAILREKVHDNRLLRLVENLLRAGYLEDWTYRPTLSGTPQGGIVSPLLANIYLDRLDAFVEDTLLPASTRGSARARNRAYQTLRHRANALRRQGHPDEARRLRLQMQRLPSIDPRDPDFRRLRYARYADDFLLGFTGPRGEAEEITRRLREFLRDTLKLELSEAKTLVTHARDEAARFLGYEIVTQHRDDKRSRSGGHRRVINGVVGLKVPADVVKAKCRPYLRHGRPTHLPARLVDSVFTTVATYQQEFRGLAEDYQLAHTRPTLSRVRWVMQASLTKTLARKLRVSVGRVYERYRTTLPTDRGPRPVLLVTVERAGKPPLVAHWGNISLARRRDRPVLDDRPRPLARNRTELLQRLLADACELCGSSESVEVHHIRRLADLRRPGQAARPLWVRRMAERQRKTLVVCHACHQAIHHGRPHDAGHGARDTAEPDAAKVARPVRRGADGKVPPPGQ